MFAVKHYLQPLKMQLSINAEVDFILLDFLDEEKWKELGQFDIIVSNPPYVKQSEKRHNA